MFLKLFGKGFEAFVLVEKGDDMKSWKLSVPGSGLGGDVLNWIPSAKAVSSRASELAEIDNQIRAVEAESSFFE